ncbi:MAG: hypothetical protein R2911_12245 [Caldilineaceae bacterium]
MLAPLTIGHHVDHLLVRAAAERALDRASAITRIIPTPSSRASWMRFLLRKATNGNPKPSA